MLVTDNYYTLVPLCRRLNKRKTHLIGTLRKNRKHLPKFVLSVKPKGGEAIANYCGPINVLKWHDKKDVLLKYGMTGKIDRKTKIKQLKPEAILEYNDVKMGIDLSDQLLNYYSCLRKSIRWYHKVAFELLLCTSVINTHILYINISPKM